MESIGKVTARLMRQLTLARHCPGIQIIEGKSGGEAHQDTAVAGGDADKTTRPREEMQRVMTSPARILK